MTLQPRNLTGHTITPMTIPDMRPNPANLQKQLIQGRSACLYFVYVTDITHSIPGFLHEATYFLNHSIVTRKANAMFSLNSNVLRIFLGCSLVATTCLVIKVLHNLLLHPNRSFPGPILARATVVISHWKTLQGTSHIWLSELHAKYGPVVRFAPNELSFIDPGVWKDVYGHGAASFTKEKASYGPDAYGNPPGLIRSDNINHARQRKLVSHAFSDKALKAQEQLLKGHVEILVQKLKEAALRDGQANLVDWYNFTTFDIMGDLTFGETLGQLATAVYSPWVKAAFSYVKVISIGRVSRGWPGMTRLLNACAPKDMKAKRQTHLDYSKNHVDKRMARKTDRPDIWTFVMKHSETEGKHLAPTELHSNGQLFMFAGTETTATELSGLTYILLKNPEKMERLVDEVRGAFTSFNDMSMSRLAQLNFLNACLEEGLRMYPPLPVGLPRVTPVGGSAVCGHWVAGGTSVQCPMYAANYSPLNWKNPALFRPERFMPEGIAEYALDRKAALNPFSFGPRNCLGKNLAYHEMRLILASVLFHFNLALKDEQQDWLDHKVHVLWDKGPLVVKLSPVQGLAR
ncbi:benzoate 4-monooxygenase cytochrome P450 [Plenodomus tracheiphilus IPT5]|uniref:Benzoate 4-monooxygenase cytochrome P450 n=1 Tax=Plenodomus tracheiphilus IPT5 TaxID=1408161 RepID=A0A6A7AWL4_9PLEO|nr:benzoate 4-monooxygenase cytochrome P450 [Plenodomus tracheiphilus IPT5]